MTGLIYSYDKNNDWAIVEVADHNYASLQKAQLEILEKGYVIIEFITQYVFKVTRNL